MFDFVAIDHPWLAGQLVVDGDQGMVRREGPRGSLPTDSRG